MMNACPRCGLELLGYNDDCPGCGHALRRRDQTMTVEPPAAPAPKPAEARPVAPARRRSVIGLVRDYFTFRKMIGPAIIPFIYTFGALLGSVGIAAYVLLSSVLFAYFTSGLSLILAIPTAVITVVFFNISWRLVCERIMLRYDMNEKLAKLTDKGRIK